MHTAIKKAPESKKIKDKENYHIYIKNLVAAALGFFFSCAKMPGGISPFSCAFLSSVESELSIFAFFGSVLSYFIFFPLETALKYLASLSLTLVLRLLLLRKMKCENKSFPSAVMCASSLLCSSVGMLSFSGFDFLSLLLAFCESILSFLSVIIYRKAFHVPIQILGLKKLSSQEGFFLLYTLCTFLLSFSSFTVGDISPARIFACIAVIFISQYKGVLYSSVFGICTGISFCLVPSFEFLFPFFALSAMVSGIFSSLGQYATSFSFLLTSFLVALSQGLDSVRLFTVIEAVIGCIIYAVIPMAKISLLQSKLEGSNLMEDKTAQRQVSKTLRNTAEKIGAVSEIVNNVSNRLDKIINPEINKVFASMQQGLCFGCGKKKECWNKYFNETANDIMTISGIRQSTSAKTNLENRCLKPNALLRHIEHHYADFVSSVAAKMKLSEMRSVVNDQFLCISDFLIDLAEKWDVSLTENESRSRSIFSVLKDSGIDVLSVKYLTGPDSPVRIEIEFYQNIDELDFLKINSILELTTSYKFRKPQVDLSPEGTKIIFKEKYTYKLICGFSQIALAENKVCGDCTEHASDENGNEILILCDGMGTGSRAAIDATMAATLLQNLLSCGFSFENSVKMVNSALIMKSTDESLSTVDAVSINLYTGQATFYKAGAAVSFIRSSNTVRLVNTPSMPIGIIRTVSAAHVSEKLTEGDIVLLVSDGVTANDCGWINDEILAWSTNNMDDLASHIASLSKIRSTKDTEDDITVIAIKVVKSDL